MSWVLYWTASDGKAKFEEYGVLFHYYYSWMCFDSEWEYLLGSHQAKKYNCPINLLRVIIICNVKQSECKLLIFEKNNW